MASLVESRHSPSSQSPPIKTTTNTLPPAPQLQPQAASSTPSPFLEIPGSFPRDTSRPSPRQNTSETSRGQSYFPTKTTSHLRTSFLIIDKKRKKRANCHLSRRKEDLITVDGERGCQAGRALRRCRSPTWLYQRDVCRKTAR